MPAVAQTLGALVAGLQLAALGVVAARLARGRRRPPPAEPVPGGLLDTTVTVVVPARNEAARIGACLAGLRAQGAPMTEVVVVDGGSTDGTAELVDAASAQDPRLRRLAEPPRPPGTVGRPWAIAAGCAVARGEWVLVVDADTAPRPGMVAGAVLAARRHGLDAVSFAPRIVAPGRGARWLQPAFLTTLVYRFGPPVGSAAPARALANGQCLLLRRARLEAAGGYGAAADSYCDDVRIVRHLARHGARVGFLDGRALLEVLMYATGRETWRAWPRSLNLRDATSPAWRWGDALLLLLAQALPVPLLAALAAAHAAGALAGVPGPLVRMLAAVNGALLLVRLLLLAATARSFAPRGIAYWLSPLADPPAALRVVATMFRPVREWRGRVRPAPRPASAT